MASKLGGRALELSIAHVRAARPICFRLLAALMRCALDFARLSAGSSIAARIATIATTASTVSTP